MAEAGLTMRTTAVLVMLAGCADMGPLAPPMDVYLVDVPEADRAAWKAAVSAWNEVVGSEVLTLMDGRPEGACGVYVRAAEIEGPIDGRTKYIDGCVTRIVYEASAVECTAAHELGHALRARHSQDATSVMFEGGCTAVMPTAKDGAAVRARWGM